MDKPLDELIAEYDFEADRKFQEGHFKKLSELLKVKKMIAGFEKIEPRTEAVKMILADAKKLETRLTKETSEQG